MRLRLGLLLGSLWMMVGGAYGQGVLRAEPVEEQRPIGPVLPPEEKGGVEEVLSQSNQFRVSGGKGGDRGGVAMVAEEAKVEFLKLTEEKDEWKVPVRIRLHGKVGDALPAKTLRLRLLEVEGMSELQIDVHLSRGVEVESIKRMVTEALVFERFLKKGEARMSEHVLTVPSWLVEGLREANSWRLNLSDRRLYAAVFKKGLFKMDDLLAVDEDGLDKMDGASKAAFRVSSGALVMSLLEQPQGKDGFRQFLTEIAGYEGEIPVLLRKHFPEMNSSETSMAKWWTLQLANKGGLNLLTDSLSVAATEDLLKAALRFQYRDKEGKVQVRTIDEWEEVMKLSEAERLMSVKALEEGLVHLSYRSFPSYRPLIREYQQVLVAMVQNKPKEIGKKLLELSESRLLMIEKAKRARDYLDWYEITRARQTSGEFEDYLKLKERLKSNPVKRTDGISKYLDQMDRLFYREEPKSWGRGGVGGSGGGMVAPVGEGLELPR